MKHKKEYKKGISVIIPTFNRAKYLYSTLICLCNQQVNETLEYEIVIIDSGDDETESVVRMFQNGGRVSIIYKRIKKCKNRSLLRNTGAALAKYDILCFLDNDMLTPPEFIQRHYDEHQKMNNLVLMQCRRLLTQFDIQQIGEEALAKDFSIIAKLPWYRDERLELYEDKDQWRFVFSHTLSMRKKDFIKAGKFNKKFGEHWGFEDLELGFNLMQIGTNFKLIKDSFTYHQPHFSQSNKEQNETRFNKDLLVALHNSYEVELYSTFYSDYGLFLEGIKKLQAKFVNPSNSEKMRFKRILGCIYSCKDPIVKSRFQLGTYIPLYNGTCKNILILSTFFSFPRLVQLSILSEAFRVSNNVYFHTLKEEEKSLIISFGKQCGLILNIHDFHKYSNVTVVEKRFSNFFTLVLPEIYCPEKRYVYSWLCKKLIEAKKGMIISDFHNIKTLANDDFRLPEQDIELINPLFTNYLGMVKFQVIYSASIYNSQDKIRITNNSDNIVFHDDEYYFNYDSLKNRGINNCRNFSELDFANLTLASIYEAYKSYPLQNNNMVKNQSYIAFMENGFYEDGIDIILESFSKILSFNPESKLTIKLPDYKDLLNGCLPWHNQSSKTNKLFAIHQKYQNDKIILENSLSKLQIEKSVEILSSNLEIQNILGLINQHSSLIYMSRSCYVPPQVYAAMLLSKNVFIGEHHIIPKNLDAFVRIIPSKKTDFAEELKVPISCMNAVYSAFRCDSVELLAAIRIKNYNNNKSCCDVSENINEWLKTAFVES